MKKYKMAKSNLMMVLKPIRKRIELYSRLIPQMLLGCNFTLIDGM